MKELISDFISDNVDWAENVFAQAIECVKPLFYNAEVDASKIRLNTIERAIGLVDLADRIFQNEWPKYIDPIIYGQAYHNFGFNGKMAKKETYRFYLKLSALFASVGFLEKTPNLSLVASVSRFTVFWDKQNYPGQENERALLSIRVNVIEAISSIYKEPVFSDFKFPLIWKCLRDAVQLIDIGPQNAEGVFYGNINEAKLIDSEAYDRIGNSIIAAYRSMSPDSLKTGEGKRIFKENHSQFLKKITKLKALSEVQELPAEKAAESLKFDFGNGFYSVLEDVLQRPMGIWAVKYSLNISATMDLIHSAKGDSEQATAVKILTKDLIQYLGSLRRTLFLEPCLRHGDDKIPLLDPRAQEFISIHRFSCYPELEQEIQYACNYLRSKGRKVDFNQPNPRSWITEEDGVTPLW